MILLIVYVREGRIGLFKLVMLSFQRMLAFDVTDGFKVNTQSNVHCFSPWVSKRRFIANKNKIKSSA